MKIKALVVGPIMENCYILYDEQTLEGIIVDPGDEATSILNVVDNLKLHIKYIVNTHGHADHIGANKELGLALKAKLAIHADDACMLTDPHLNLSENGYMGRPIISQPADIILHEGDIISFGNCNLKVIHTPGHTPGGICLVGEGVVMSGDSLFAGSIGRTDFPTGSMTDLISNLKAKILTLDENLTLIDTPGILEDGNIMNLLDSKSLKKIIPRKEIKPITYQVKSHQWIVIDRLVIMESSLNNLTFFFSNELKIERYYHNKENNHLKENMIRVKKGQDIVISGLGFIKVMKDEVIKIKTLDKVDVYTRTSLI